MRDSLYKFTLDAGLFFSHVKDSTYLINFVENELDTRPDLRMKNVTRCRQEEPEGVFASTTTDPIGGITVIDNKIKRFVAPYNERNCIWPPIGTGGGGSGSGSGGNHAEPNIREVINNLTVCEGYETGSILKIQNWFGKRYSCKDYWNGHNRVKTEFWDQNWWVHTSIGIQVRSQKKRAWIWWTTHADEIHLGINKAHLIYRYPAPKITFPSFPQFNNNPNKQLYIYNEQISLNFTGVGKPIQFKIDKNNPLPFFHFKNEDILTIYIEKIPIYGTLDFTLNTSYVNKAIDELIKMGANAYKKLGQPKDKDFAVIWQKNYGEIEVFYFGEHYMKHNSSKIKKLFYSDTGFEIGVSWTDGPNGGWKFKGVRSRDDLFRQYTHYSIDCYGMAKRWGSWKGNRVVGKIK